jgi:GDP-D-mannose dehydratase
MWLMLQHAETDDLELGTGKPSDKDFAMKHFLCGEDW